MRLLWNKKGNKMYKIRIWGFNEEREQAVDTLKNAKAFAKEAIKGDGFFKVQVYKDNVPTPVMQLVNEKSLKKGNKNDRG